MLRYRPDFEEVKKAWRAYWEKEIIDRPCAYVTAPKNPAQRKNLPHQTACMAGIDGQIERDLRIFDEWAESTYFAGEALPFVNLSFGPDQFAAFLGAELTVASDMSTSWSHPFVSDWSAARLELRDDNPHWRRMLEFIARAAQFSEGKFLVAMIDIHSNMDCLSAARGAQNLCMDLLDCPDGVERAMRDVRALYAPIYNALYTAGRMAERRSSGQAPFYCEGRFAMTQCDFICMISPSDFRRFVLPAIEEESAFLDRSVFHLDGPQALKHLDDLLAVERIDAIQWVPGAGAPQLGQWLDVLKRIQKAGKGLHLYGLTIEETKRLHKELRPEGVVYCVDAPSAREADKLLAWLRNNT